MPITTKVVSSSPVHGQMYLIQHHVIKYVSDLRQVGGFPQAPSVSSNNKTDRHDITEIVLKVMLNTLNLDHYEYNVPFSTGKHFVPESRQHIDRL